ncbi:MAG: hypothetical protein ABIL66_02005 [candidate division WOR-3 bacterium]
MNLILLIISSAGISGLLMPASVKGVITYYSRSIGDEAIFYNPAMFGADNNYRLNIYYTHTYASMKNINLGLSRKFRYFDLGISIMNFDYGEIEARPDYPTEDSAGFYTGSDFYFGVSLAKSITSNGRIGIKAKYIYENLYIYSDATLGFDFSLAYINQFSGLSVGATNIGGTITIANESVNLPTKFSFGYYRMIKKYIISVDLHYRINSSSFESSLAGEMMLTKNFEIGVSVNYRDQLYPGFYLAIHHHGLAIKYGASLYPYNLGMVNIIGIGFPF